jgi:hypothetical protein
MQGKRIALGLESGRVIFTGWWIFLARRRDGSSSKDSAAWAAALMLKNENACKAIIYRYIAYYHLLRRG